MPARLRSTGSRISLAEIADRNGIALGSFPCHERSQPDEAAGNQSRLITGSMSPAQPAPQAAAKPRRRQSPRALLAWYDRHHRDLPWRVAPRDRARGVRPDPYRVWLSEIMLQQTTVEAVKPYFRAFRRRWPDVDALAARRSRRRHDGLGGARLLFARPQPEDMRRRSWPRAMAAAFPTREDGLRALPGIGAYTAAAIAAIAFDRPAAVVDGNVERVMSPAVRDRDAAARRPSRRSATIVEQLVPSDRPAISPRR